MEVACSGLWAPDFSSLPIRGDLPKRLLTTMISRTRPSTDSPDFVRCRIPTSSSELKKKKTEKYAGLAKYTYLKKEKIRWHKALMQCQIVRKSFQRVVWLCAWMIACPQFKNSFVLNYKGFFYRKEVRKAQPFSGMLWFAWDFGHPPLKFVFCQCKGCPTLRGTHATSIFGKYLFGRLFEI